MSLLVCVGVAMQRMMGNEVFSVFEQCIATFAAAAWCVAAFSSDNSARTTQHNATQSLLSNKPNRTDQRNEKVRGRREGRRV